MKNTPDEIPLEPVLTKVLTTIAIPGDLDESTRDGIVVNEELCAKIGNEIPGAFLSEEPTVAAREQVKLALGLEEEKLSDKDFKKYVLPGKFTNIINWTSV